MHGADTFFLAVTWCGSLYLLLPAASLIGFGLCQRARIQEAMLLVSSLAVTVAAVHAVKLLCRRPQPESLATLVAMPADWSFPSAHTAQAAAFFLSLCVIAWRLLPSPWQWTGNILCLFLCFGVGWSRLYLRVHHLSDVLGGFLLGWLVVVTLFLLIRASFNHRKP